ncbi:hypothetical protein [Jejubacter sp. L23]|uniref:hypothetical protein n=1 Tax=Jejubacter sp. L23 TaxID=3092086 RepID=UPI003D70E6FC
MSNVSIEGIMCIPPNDAEPGVYFERMRNIACEHNIYHISMGMSNDFKIALNHGATMIRVGSLIFGERISYE